jgi:protein ImuB
MSTRFISIWFRHLTTDRVIIRQPEHKNLPFVLAAPERGRMIVKAANKVAEAHGIEPGTVVADARAILPSLKVLDDPPGLAGKLLKALAEWCIRYTPIAAIDAPDGLILDATGCAHLWGGEKGYLKTIVLKLRESGFDVRAAIADTIGTAWAVARYGKISPIIEEGGQVNALLHLPPAALRLEIDVLERMHKLGFYQISQFISMPRSTLRRRFGQMLLDRLDQALGVSAEPIEPVCPVEPYQERLPSLEPIVTAQGIKIALRRLLDMLCKRLVKEGKGLRTGVFKGFRLDGQIEKVEICTTSASAHADHLFKLFELKISTMKPDLGIELFLLEAPVVEDAAQVQETLWNTTQNQAGVAELLDRLAVRAGMQTIRRYLPDEHHWPERSVKLANSLHHSPETEWQSDRLRPSLMLSRPEPVEVTSPMPDYPPILFRYKGQVHNIRKADGPERIESEWWIQEGLHRDYYVVEDQSGARYWLFRLGHYQTHKPEWFIHGFFS